MSNIFANYRSGDIDPSGMKPSYKVSDLVGRTFRIRSMKRLTQKTSQFSDEPTMLVNAAFSVKAVDDPEDGEFVFFAQQKVLYSKFDYLYDLYVDGNEDVLTTNLSIIKQATKDGKATYYDLVQVD